MGRALAALAGVALAGRAGRAVAAPQINGEPFLSEIRLFGGNFAPNGWAFCDGQLLSIGGNTALFSLIGAAYGGDGVTTFALPDLRGRVPVGVGQGLGLGNRVRGEMGGEDSVALAFTQLPQHTHPLWSHGANGSTDGAVLATFARAPSAIPQFSTTPNAVIANDAVEFVGSGDPHNNLQPYGTMNFIIALQGVFPSMG